VLLDPTTNNWPMTQEDFANLAPRLRELQFRLIFEHGPTRLLCRN